jgi:Mrp family chromosome partitioning ATPase/capsular polysaccharide biosynthesis protein
MEPKTTTQPRIADYIRPLISRWWLILIAVLVATGGVYAYYAHKPNVYSTSTLVYYQDPGDPVTGLPNPAQSTDRVVLDQATLLYSRATAAAVAAKIGFRGTLSALLQQVTISSKQGQDFVQIAAQAGSPGEAATIANAFAQRLGSSLGNSVTVRTANALRTSKNELAQLPRGPASDAQRADLLSQINRLQLELQNPPTVARQVDPAQPPTSPSAPKPARNALFALILSLVGAIGVAYGLERFDRRLKDPEEMENAYGRPLLAVVPHTGNPAPFRDGEPALGSEFREPFRVLRTNIELASVDAPPRTIVVSSAMPGEGKSTVVRNLALAFREAGKRVAVVELDLRHPALAPLFGADVSDGITEVLRHDAKLVDVALQITVGLPALDELLWTDDAPSPARNGANGGNGAQHKNGAVPHGSEVTVLLSGARPANPPAVLASERLVKVLDALRERHDVVLIDSAPVLAVADTVPLLRYADAALFVGRLDVTTRDTAKRLMEFLARVPDLNLLGIVANDLSRHEAGSYGYGYGYGSYGEEPKRGRGPRRKAAPERPKQTV